MVLATEQQRITTTGKTYAYLTFVDPVDGSVSYYISDSGFSGDNTFTGPRVYPAVSSWGKFRKMITDGDVRDADFELTLFADAIVHSSNKANKRYRVYELLRRAPLYTAEVYVYQWNAADTSQSVIWHGFLVAVSDASYEKSGEGGQLLVTLRFSNTGTAVLAKIGPTVGQDIYTGCPTESKGKVASRAYGKLTTGFGTSGAIQEAMFLGYPSRFIEGIKIAEDGASGEQTYLFTREDTLNANALINSGTTLDPRVDSALWLYLSAGDTFGMIDKGDITLTNDSTEAKVKIALDPHIWTPILPGAFGSLMSAGLTANAYKVTNSDPNDHLDTTNADVTIAFEVPPISISGFKCERAIVMVDVDGDPGIAAATRTFDFGLWDVNHNGGAAFWGSAAFGAGTKGTKTINVGAGATARARFFMESAGALRYYDSGIGADAYVATDAVPEFQRGEFIGRDVNGNSKPIQVALSVTAGSDANKGGVRVYGMSVILYGRAGLYGDRIKTAVGIVGYQIYDVQGKKLRTPVPIWGWKQFNLGADPTKPEKKAVVLCSGWFQKDNGTTYQGATSGDTIEKGSGIVHHLLARHGGFNTNAAVGTPGNFVDARVEDVAGEKTLAIELNGDFRETQSQLREQHPMLRFHDEDGTYCATYETMNPHQSNFYGRSIAAIDIDPTSFRISADPLDEIVNNVRVNYGHGYRRDRALGSVTYVNDLSKSLFGLREPLSVEAQWIVVKDLASTSAPPEATFLAQYLGRHTARPKLTVNCRLPQGYFDLKRGMILDFDSKMEQFGFHCLAYRCGQMNYIFWGSAGTNRANSPTAIIVGTGGTPTLFGFDQQIDGLNYVIGTAGVYTAIGTPWGYSDGTASPATWPALSNQVNPEGFKTLGSGRTSWDKPNPWAWKKQELSVTAYGMAGPCYWVRYNYGAVSTQAVLSDLVTHDPKWPGRYFEMNEMTGALGGYLEYPRRELVLREVM